MKRLLKEKGIEVTTSQIGDFADVTIKLDAEMAKRLMYELSTTRDAGLHHTLDALAEAIGGYKKYNEWIDEYESKLYDH